MQGNFQAALARVLVYEGGFSNDPHDPGGATNFGITQAVYNSWRARNGQATQSVQVIEKADVAAIYETDYWNRIDGDELPSGVDFCMFDASVNSGVGAATGWAQGCCGIGVDGDFGPKTKTSILAEDPDTFIKDFDARRLGTLKRLKTWTYFGKGWSARISNVQKTSLAWADAGDAPDPIQVHMIGGHAKARTSDIPPVSTTGLIAAHATAAGGAVATAATQLGQSLTGIDSVFSFMKYVLGGVTVLGAVAGVVVYMGKIANDAANNATAKATVDPDADAAVPSTSVTVKPAAQVPTPVAKTGA